MLISTLEFVLASRAESVEQNLVKMKWFLKEQVSHMGLKPVLSCFFDAPYVLPLSLFLDFEEHYLHTVPF